LSHGCRTVGEGGRRQGYPVPPRRSRRVAARRDTRYPLGPTGVRNPAIGPYPRGYHPFGAQPLFYQAFPEGGIAMITEPAKTFSRMFRGYDPAAVDAYIEMLITKQQLLLDDMESLRARL